MVLKSSNNHKKIVDFLYCINSFLVVAKNASINICVRYFVFIQATQEPVFGL